MGTERGTLGILAGGGTLPRRIADSAREDLRPVFIIAFTGQTDPATVADLPHAWVRLGEAGRAIAELKRAGAAELVMAGPVRRPSWSEIGLDWRGAQIVAKIGARALGDDGLLSGLARELEGEGFRLVGVTDLLTDGLVAKGVLGRHAPDKQARDDIARGVDVARVLGEADVGQSVVVQQGLVLGVEAIEGTDALLARARDLARAGVGGVLVKIAKPRQDRRMDLPTIGQRTLALAAEAGLRGVAIEAAGTIVVDVDACISEADRLGLFLIAIDPAETSAK
ncbi:MAG TPA: UDP-2,3-diacylglucosamine diphosphatase LpxI [Alphaproteobacteria bacterium]|nr:UDP-2,3-diacylglucosamine diphosphatase LpxI [Alphaproteobacteria bacterium]